MKRILLAILSVLVAITSGLAQCPDFTDLNAPGVACWTGNDVIGSSNGPIPGRYAVVTQQGMDPYTGYQLPILPPGESAVVKLGNDQGGMQLEGIDYDFVVDPDYPILTIKYAFVLQNYGDISSGCPSFDIYVLQPDSENHLMSQSIYPCGQFAFNNLQYHDEVHVTGTVIWRQWTTICIDVSDYVGQQIRVRFVTYDGMHNLSTFAYAYFTASCMSDHLTVVGCDGENVILSAPEGFDHYEWNNGATTQTTSYPINEGLDVACTLISAHGCLPIMGHENIEGLTITQGASYYDTICEGESYQAHGFNLPQQNTPGFFTFTRISLNPNDCLSGTLYKLHLTVRQRDIHYYDHVCEGADYDQYGFHYTNLETGILTDSLPLTNDNGCSPAYKYLHLTVDPSLANSGELFGETVVCDHEVYTYTLNYPGVLSQYQWIIPEGVTNFSSYPGETVLLYFTENAPNPVVISVTATDGCGDHTLSKAIYHNPSYYYSYQDTVCTGDIYNNHGIQTALLDSAGIYYLSSHNTTVTGCDSNVTVRLWVGSTPTVSTLAQPEAICEGQSTVIHAIGENASFNMLIPLDIIPGDILCTDNTIEKPENFSTSGKTAKGVVFYVDTTGEHGWAVHLQNHGCHEYWLHDVSTTTIIYANLTQYHTSREALSDLNGLLNTQIIRSIDPSYSFSGDVNSEWYVPAIGQLRILDEERDVINTSLQIAGGVPLFETTTDWTTTVTKYWSSTICDATSSSFPHYNNRTAWYLNSSGVIRYQGIYALPNDGYPGVPGTRLICNF